MDISLAQRNGAQANDVFFYDYSYTYNYGGISYESSMSTGKIYYADNVSYATTSKKYEISAYSYPNTVTSFSGEHIEGLDTVTMGVRFGDLTLFSGIDGNNHLIGWDYSVEYDNNNLGTASGTLKIDNDTYDTMQKAVACVAIIAAAAVVSYFCPPVGLAIGASGGAVGGLAF